MSDTGIQKTTLSNGVRVLTERVDHVGSASIGLWCQTGSAQEFENEAGITHLIEHMLFKGTPKRSAKEIAEAIEGRGGMLNAFTDKEQTCYYCRVLADDSENAVDVLTDMMTHSLIDADELEMEKGVVLEEIKRGEDEPGDLVFDLHLQGLWEDHELGKPVIGTKESVSSFGRQNLVDYMDRQYRGNRVVLTSAGRVDHDSFVRWAEEKLGHLPAGDPNGSLARPKGQPGTQLVQKEIEQVHFCIGTDGVSHYDDTIYIATLLDAVLGGGMSGRLFQEVREKRGLVYAIASYNLIYSSGGAFTVWGGTSPEKWEQLQSVVRDVFDDVRTNGPTEEELTRVKRQIRGNLVLGLEGMSNRMMRMSRNELIHGRQIPIEETLAKLEAVTCGHVRDYAHESLDEERMRVTSIQPR
ncbi:MAG: insulinase family protein [Fimbriimonadaceae bacterium]|jgi:predicted Zn-dependent peptidase|nr:insulinase family protein [Fimbriimonadaceae bacterium]